MGKCDRCNFCNNTSRPETFGRGAKNAKIMIIQDVVSSAESKRGIQFWGKSCDRLRENMKKREIDIDEVYWTSVIKCPLPDEFYKPTIKESRECSDTLLAEIEIVDPDIIVPMGNLALKYTLNRSDLTRARGNAQEVELEGRTRIILPIIHPRQALKKPVYQDYILKDLDSLKELSESGLQEVSGVDYRSLETIPEVLTELDRLKDSEWISFDLETTGLSPFEEDSKIVCISLTDKPYYGVVIPLYHKETPFTNPELGTVVKALRKLLQSSKTKKVAHNGKFDIKWLKAWLDIEVANFCFDTMFGHYITISEEQGTQGLKSMAWEFTDMGGYDNALDEFKKTLPESIRNNYDNIPWKILSTYAVADVDCCIRLKDLFLPKIEANPKWSLLIKDFMMPASYALRDLEIDGMLISDKVVTKYSVTYTEEINRIKKQLESYPEVVEIERERAEKYREREQIALIKKADRTEEEQRKFEEYKKYKDPKFAWSSPIQLKELLFDRLGLTTTVTTAKGALSTGEDALIEMSEQHELPLLMMELRKVLTLNNMFIKKLPTMRDSNGIIHPVYNLVGTVTGRLASENPNFQQMPRKTNTPSLFQYQNEPKAMFVSKFNHDPGNIRSIKRTDQGCIVNLDYCLAPDTRVELINGESDTIKSICDRVTSGENLYTYSINPKTEEIEVSRIVAGKKTRTNDKTLKITLDNGECIVSSYNHKFLQRNGVYTKAEDLEIGTSLMGFQKLEVNTDYGVTYRSIGVNKNFINHEYEHILIYKYFNSSYTPRVPIHHKNGNGLDKRGLEITENNYETVRKQITKRGVTWEKAVEFLLEDGYISNHKIVFIEPYENMDLYDIEVEKHHNFALSSGIFVHNSQLELRIAGIISNDKALIDTYKSGIDLHIATASKTFGVPMDEVSSDLRTKAKAVSFGIIYSKSGATFGKELYLHDLFKEAGDEKGDGKSLNPKTRERIQQKAKKLGYKLVEDYLSVYPQLSDWLDNTREFAMKNGYVETMFGRRRRLPDLYSTVNSIRENAIRQSVNAPIQGTGSDMTLRSIIEIQNYIKKNHLKSRMAGTVHDSIVFDVYLPELTDIIPAAKYIMEHVHEPYMDTEVPMLSEIELGDSYGGVFEIDGETLNGFTSTDDYFDWLHENKLKKYKKEIDYFHDKAGYDEDSTLAWMVKNNRPIKEIEGYLKDVYSK